MATSIAWRALAETNRPARVLDPMVGSGTTAMVARSLGHRAVGYDTDPLAVLLATTWCSDVQEQRVRDAAERLLRNAVLRHRGIPLAEAYPKKQRKKAL